VPAKDPRHALKLIDRLGLYSTIFTNPTIQDQVPSTDHWARAYDCLEALRSNDSPECIYKTLIRSEEAEYYAWVLASLSPWSLLPVYPANGPKNKAPVPRATPVAREGIKAPTRLCDLVTGAFEHFKPMIAMKKAVVENQSWVNERDKLGMTIRGWDARGGHWKVQMMFAILVENMEDGARMYCSTGFLECISLT
jgi:tRNA nucleotidyltransferase (CCA-adding enzyme)